VGPSAARAVGGPTASPARASAGVASPARSASPDHGQGDDEESTVKKTVKKKGKATEKGKVKVSERDQRVLDLLVAHRIATSNQISRWAPFPNGQRARDRLRYLADNDILDRFRPYRRPGSAPFHYVLGREGAAIHAARTGQPTPRPGEITDAKRRLEYSPNRAHMVAVVEFFTRLYAAGRAMPDGALAVWWSEDETADKCEGIVRPDSYGEWVTRPHRAPSSTAPSGAPRVVGFFYEHDRGSESLQTLLGKLDRYAALARERGKRRPVLIELPTPVREDNLHEELTRRHGPHGHRTVYVASTNAPLWASAAHGPAGAVWRPATTGPRRRLADLPTIADSSQVPS
jgi:hypothetical protein